jgi:hypothetical protein
MSDNTVMLTIKLSIEQRLLEEVADGKTEPETVTSILTNQAENKIEECLEPVHLAMVLLRG